MKSCFGLLLVFLITVAVLGTGGLIWYLSAHTEFSRTDAGAPKPPMTAPGNLR